MQETRPYIPGARVGTWTRLVETKNSLGESHEREAVTFADRITEPPRERLQMMRGVSSRTPPDHDSPSGSSS